MLLQQDLKEGMMIAKVIVKKGNTLIDEFMCYADNKDTLVKVIYKEKVDKGFEDRHKFDSRGIFVKEENKEA